MTSETRKLSLFAVFTFLAAGSVLSVFGQDRTLWRTANDIREGTQGRLNGTVVDVDDSGNRLQVVTDADRYTRISVVTDSVSTQYTGFGTVLPGDRPEVFAGTDGFNKVRIGDRVEIRGTGRASKAVYADQVNLLGRSSTASTGTTSVGSAQTGTTVTGTSSRYEGIVRQVNPNENRLVIETDRREMFTVTGSYSTPVSFKGDTYHIANIEVGDRIRVEPASVASGELRAKSIEVVSSVTDTAATGSQDRTVASITGRVTKVDSATSFRIDTGRPSDVRVDATDAYDDSGRRLRATDLQVGDRVSITGTYDRNDLFHASTVRFGEYSSSGSTNTVPGRSGGTTGSSADYLTSVIYASVTDTLTNSPQLVIRDTSGDRTIRLYVSDDFIVRTKTGGYITADALKKGEQIVVKAYRDPAGNYIAQTIRVR
jgi:Domain of unknown function (DUF5666)